MNEMHLTIVIVAITALLTVLLEIKIYYFIKQTHLPDAAKQFLIPLIFSLTLFPAPVGVSDSLLIIPNMWLVILSLIEYVLEGKEADFKFSTYHEFWYFYLSSFLITFFVTYITSYILINMRNKFKR